MFVLSCNLSSDLNPRNTTDWRRDFRAHKRDVQVYDNMAIGKIEAFDETSDNWNAYVERVEQYFIANDIKENKQVAVMLCLMGNKTYGLLRNLSAPAKPSCLFLKSSWKLYRNIFLRNHCLSQSDFAFTRETNWKEKP